MRNIDIIIKQFEQNSKLFSKITKFLNNLNKYEQNLFSYCQYRFNRFQLESRYYFDKNKDIEFYYNDANTYLRFYGCYIPLSIFKNGINKETINNAFNYLKNKLDKARYEALNIDFKIYDYFHQELKFGDDILIFDEELKHGTLISLEFNYKNFVLVKIENRNEYNSFNIVNNQLKNIIKIDSHLETLLTMKKLKE